MSMAKNTAIRKSAVAGRFYPENKEILQRKLEAYFANASEQFLQSRVLICPHAGIIYSGETACWGYRTLENLDWDKVMILGPSHYLPYEGIASCSYSHFATPLGEILLEHDELNTLKEKFSFIHNLDAAHVPEHSIEIHLPFLQHLKPEGFTLLPLLCGECDSRELADLLHAWLDNHPKNICIISSDLSHFLTEEEAKKKDLESCRRILNFHSPELHTENACGFRPVNGLRLYAHEQQMTLHLLDYRTSADTSGDSSRVVGYSSFAGSFKNDHPLVFSRQSQQQMISFAKACIAAHLRGEELPSASSTENWALLCAPVFVTLTLQGELRGCIGSLYSQRTIEEELQQHSFNAAFRDPRFPPLTQKEFKKVRIEISVLGPATAVEFRDEKELEKKLRPSVDGLTIRCEEKRATFLPSVWKQIPDPHNFIRQLKRKAGLNIEASYTEMQAETYQCIKIKES